MIVFDVSVTFDVPAGEERSLRRFLVKTQSLSALRVLLREHAARNGYAFRRIFLFHDITLEPNAAEELAAHPEE